MADRLAVEADRRGRPHQNLAAQGARQFVLAVSGNTGDAEDFAGSDIEGDAFEIDAEGFLAGQVQGVDRQPRFGFDLDAAAHQCLQFAADHQLRHAACRLDQWIAFADHAAAPQHRRMVAQFLDLLQFVRDVEDRTALVGQLAKGDEQPVNLLRRQHRGRFVHDQQLRILQQAADDFDALPFADRQGVDFPAGVERQSVFPRNIDHAPGQFLEIGRIVDAERDVLQHRHRFEQ